MLALDLRMTLDEILAENKTCITGNFVLFLLFVNADGEETCEFF